MKLVNQFISILSAAILTAASASTLLAELPDPDGKPADIGKPVKVFIIMGQSNTLEMGKVKGDKEGSLEYAVKKEKLYPFMVDEAGAWTKRMFAMFTRRAAAVLAAAVACVVMIG